MSVKIDTKRECRKGLHGGMGEKVDRESYSDNIDRHKDEFRKAFQIRRKNLLPIFLKLFISFFSPHFLKNEKWFEICLK